MKTNILQYLEDTAKKYPDKIAFADTTEMLSFKQLEANARTIGSFLLEKTAPKKPVVIYMKKGANNLNAFLGAVYAGCFYVPIDSGMPKGRVSLILSTLKPSVVIYDDSTNKNLKELNIQCQCFNYKDTLSITAENKKLDINLKLDKIRNSHKSTNLLYVLFTSGSTGTPKGVTISHQSVIDFVEWICGKYSLNAENTICNQAPFYFDASVPDLYIPLKTGATVFIPPKMFYTFPKKILAYVVENKVNTLIWVPSALCNVVNCKALDLCVPSKLKLVIFCGEVMPCKHLNVWRKALPHTKFVNMYGPTEATYACTYYEIDKEFCDDDKLPLGKACENSEIILLDEKNALVADGELGEICILGQCLSNGYYANKKKTDEAFVQNPLNLCWNEMMYRTGDLAYKNENGELIFAGRKDFQIKRLGHRIELGEIENAILSIDGIDCACCIYNEENSDIIGVYVGKLEVEQLRDQISKKLLKYMMPNRIEKLSSMPMNLNGKIDRTKLKQIYA